MIKLFRNLGYGINGLMLVIRTEANMQRLVACAVAVIVLGVVFQISLAEWAMVAGCIGIMFALECVNTAIERLADRVTKETDPLIGQAKDAAAAAVLIMSVAVATIGTIIFLPKLMAALQ